VAYKQLASAFYAINSKHRISWECSKLLIELGGGSSLLNTNCDALPLSPSTSISALAMSSVVQN
jgi:hypothetical protein